MTVHVYTTRKQPATRYKIDLGEGIRPMIVRRRPQARVWCQCCRKLRWASRCVVQVYYDKIDVFCSDGAGCKKGGKKSAKRA